MKNEIIMLVDKANEDIKKYGKKIHFEKEFEDEDYYCVDILDINDEGEATGLVNFADNYFEHELPEVIQDAWDYVKDIERMKETQQGLICYRKLSGWTHDLPALFCSLTEFPLFFADINGTIEDVDDNGGIDAYEDRKGCFVCRPEDYEPALRQIEDHDNRGVER